MTFTIRVGAIGDAPLVWERATNISHLSERRYRFRDKDGKLVQLNLSIYDTLVMVEE